MSIQIPSQLRSVDAFGENRFSSTVNRFSRVITGGRDAILFPQQSLLIERVEVADTDPVEHESKLIRVSSGVCVKDDLLIHFTEDFPMHLEDPEYFVTVSDCTSAYTDPEYLYVLMEYSYQRQWTPPVAYLRLARRATYLLAAHRYIFLGCVKIDANGSLYDEPNCIYDYDPSNTGTIRPELYFEVDVIDGGLIA